MKEASLFVFVPLRFRVFGFGSGVFVSEMPSTYGQTLVQGLGFSLFFVWRIFCAHKHEHELTHPRHGSGVQASTTGNIYTIYTGSNCKELGRLQ